MKIKTPQQLSKDRNDKLSNLEAIAEFNFSLSFFIPGIATPLVRSAVFLKGLYHGANTALICAQGYDSLNQSSSLTGKYYTLK